MHGGVWRPLASREDEMIDVVGFGRKFLKMSIKFYPPDFSFHILNGSNFLYH